MRRSPQLMVMGLALATAAACSDSVTTRLMAPGSEAIDSRSSGSTAGGALATGTSWAGVAPKSYEGNQKGEGSAVCSALGFGTLGVKVDGANSQRIAGYQITISADKQSLAFAPIAGTTPTTTILGVVVKGGNGYNVYRYSGPGITMDGGLISPSKGGGIPQISHYVVCYGPASATPVFTKKLAKVLTELVDAQGNMLADPTYTGEVVTIPAGKIRWMYYELSYSLPAGVTGTISENEVEVCNTMGSGVNEPGTGMISCSFDWSNASPVPTKSGSLYTWSGVRNSGKIVLPIDIGHGGLICGDRVFKNTATLTTSTGQTYTAISFTTIRFVCEVKFTKRLDRVLTIVDGKMVDDPAYTGGAVTIPVGETRWLDYVVEYSLPAGVTGAVTENETAVCNTLGAADVNHPGDGTITCSFNWGMSAPSPVASGGIGTWSGIGGTGSILVPIDLYTGGLACGDRTLTNTAVLTTSSGATYTAKSNTLIKFGTLAGKCP